jgi:hypothetical protein
MPAPPFIDYVFCPDGTTAIGDNCGSSVPLYEQERIALAKITSDPVFQAAVEAERPKMDNELEPQKPIDTKTIVIVLGVGLLAYYLIKKTK